MNTCVTYLRSLSPKDGKEHWTKPAENMIEINVDTAVFEELERFVFDVLFGIAMEG